MDPEDGMAMGFGDKCHHRGVGGGIKERTGDRDLGHILFQDRRGLYWPAARALRTQDTSP
jgi:hypothetical protein